MSLIDDVIDPTMPIFEGLVSSQQKKDAIQSYLRQYDDMPDRHADECGHMLRILSIIGDIDLLAYMTSLYRCNATDNNYDLYPPTIESLDWCREYCSQPHSAWSCDYGASLQAVSSDNLQLLQHAHTGDFDDDVIMRSARCETHACFEWIMSTMSAEQHEEYDRDIMHELVQNAQWYKCWLMTEKFNVVPNPEIPSWLTGILAAARI